MLESTLSPLRLMYLYQDIRPLAVDDLLRVHDAHTTEESEAGLFCDGYLVRNSPLYGRTRRILRQAGFRLSSEDSPLLRAYLSFPLACLQDILAQRCIPYRNTVDVLRLLAARRPHCQLSMQFLFTSLHRNPVMHESAHAAWEILAPAQEWAFTGDRARTKSLLFSALIAESFANSTEVLFANQASTVMELIGILHTSYVGNPRLESRLQLQQLGEAKAVHGCLLIGFLFANLLHSSASEAVFEQVASEFFPQPLPKEKAQQLRNWFGSGFHLSKDFRTLTTRNYCHIHGWDEEFRDLTRLNLFAHPEIAREVFSTVRSVLDTFYTMEESHAVTPTACATV